MDDLLISAPMYSLDVNTPEYGRVYVYRNNQVSFQYLLLALLTCIEVGATLEVSGHNHFLLCTFRSLKWVCFFNKRIGLQLESSKHCRNSFCVHA